MKKIGISLILLSFLLGSCGSSKKTVEEKIEKTEKPVINKKDIPSDYGTADIDMLKYIARYKSIAQREMKEFGIPASITIAQGILESQSGKSELAQKANNHFGIKCHSDWQGDKYLYDDDELQECFRKYEKPEESYVDHSKFLANRRRYAFLFRLPKTDYEAWAKGLKKAGYATDPSYPDKLIYLINKYHLHDLDKEVLKEMSIKVEKQNDTTSDKDKKFIYEVKAGETLFTISKKFNIPVKKIQEINNLNDFDIYEGQILVLTESENTPDEQQSTGQVAVDETEDQPETVVEETSVEEKNVSSPIEEIPEKERYIVKEGETLFSIAKKFNLKLEDLLQANKFDKDSKISVGQVIRVPFDKAQKTEKSDNSQTASNETHTEKQENKPVYHIVKPGETLYRIHVNYGVSIQKLRKLNHLKGNNIKVGQKIRVK